MFYLTVRTVFAVLQMFPIEQNLRTACLLARHWPRLMPRHRRRAVEHLTAAFGDTHTPDQIQRMADRCLECVAMFAVEAICLPRLITPYNWNRYLTTMDFTDALDQLLSGRGTILVTGHYGSFEIQGHLLATLGLDVAAVMRPLDNEYLNRFLVQSRGAQGMMLLDKKGATAQAQRLLAEGRALAFVGDQDAGRKGLFVDFFGRPASTYKSIGLLAISTGSVIIVGYVRRQGNKPRYDVGIERVIHPHEWEDRDDPLRWITQTYTSALESVIRREPEQYLWIHRRWKSQPRKRVKNGKVRVDS